MINNDSLNTSFWVMIVLRTIGAIDAPGTGPRKLPAPSAYVAILVAWLGLDIAADAGMERASAAVGWFIVLATLVLGPVGKTLTGLLANIAQLYGGPTGSTGAVSGTSSTKPA